MDSGISWGVLLLDYTLGAAMWTLIGRFGMTIFLNEDNGPPRSVGSYRRLPLLTSDRS